MIDASMDPTAQTWHTENFLVRIARGESINPSAEDEGATWARRDTPADAEYGVATLALLSGDPKRQEHLAVLRDTTAPERDIAVFGARTKSSWALNVLAGRFTGHAHTWASLRAAILDLEALSNNDMPPVVGGITLNQLSELSGVLYERDLDPEAFQALAEYISAQVVAGQNLHEQFMEPLAERLLQHGRAESVRALMPRLTKSTWVRHALAMELQHPRFGGSIDSMFRLLNEPYYRAGLEPIERNDAEGESLFQQLTASARSEAVDGPLVTVIMVTSEPGHEIFVAVRSLIAQSYTNWELVITDDSSSSGASVLLDEVAALDERIRVVRNDEDAGEFVRRNEALQSADGVFVTMRDANVWSHPRTLEIQVVDLLTMPSRLGNVIKAVGVSDDLSFVDRPGAELFIAESSLMFRREEVLSTIGYFDSVRVGAGAGAEFRQRLECATGLKVPVLLPGAPLEFVRETSEAYAERDPKATLWNSPDRMMYWSGTQSNLARVQGDHSSPFVAFPLADRQFAAPARWVEASPEVQRFDLVLVLDGREFSKLRDFHTTVASELEHAASKGMRIAFLQSYSVGGPRGLAPLAPALQNLVDSRVISRILEEDEVETGVVVVRHAGAAQGHQPERRSITASRVVVVEDSAARDARGQTFARGDVDEVVTAWFEVEPEWEVAAPTLPAAQVKMLDFDGGRLEITLATAVPRRVRSVRLTNESATVVLESSKTAAEALICYADIAVLTGREWAVSIEYDAGSGQTVIYDCAVTISTVILNAPHQVAVRTANDGFVLLAQQAVGDLPGRDDFVNTFLNASAEHSTVVGEKFQVGLAQGNAASVSRVYGLRKVDAGAVRRRDFTVGRNADSAMVWERPLAKFTDARWRLYGTFRTPLGLVEYPIHVDAEMKLVGNQAWAPQLRPSSAILVAPPVPGRVTRAARRVANSLSEKILGLRAAAGRSSNAGTVSEKIHFDASHGEPRIEATPTVTVVMPVYNVEPFLDVAISSVLDQEFADLELILIDDASTDGGRRIIRKYWQSDRRVRVFALDHNTIGGAGVPSNIGIRAARGEYVAFADSDDHVTPAGLARMVSLAETHEAELVIGDFKTFSESAQEGAESYDRRVWGELALNAPISAFTDPALFRLSPVPWRKLYRRSFLQKHAIEYPEGDYFYEDNPLHWFVLSRATKVVMCDEVISYHRMEREGQTMSAATYKLGAFVNHMNTILNFLAASTHKHRDVLFEAFYDYLARTNWVAKDQTQQAAAELIRFGISGVYKRARAAAPSAAVAPKLRARLAAYDDAYPDLDLSVVIPVFNSADLLKQTLDSVLATAGIRYNVLLVDDGSTDDSLSIMQEYENKYDNVHVFAQGNRGAGRARNSVIPLATGRYSFFLDADDVIDPEALAAAVKHADAESADLLFMKYKLEYADEGRHERMLKADREIWRQLRGVTSNAAKQRVVAQLVNYPWNRIIRTSLLHDANIFFGATVVHNDVQFHWHTIVSAQKIAFVESAVTTHRKFATRAQVTNIEDARRIAVLEALRSTHERIAGSDGYENIHEEWQKFALHLLEWAKSRIPESLHSTYEARRRELEGSFNR
ncbi:glycosyltransferase family 2 protein [Microbacterium sp. A82]|uniref:glycosyltransferase family 2 protein n=1 Tax=Microbacterium sp. A82 TaxID=3450452 RepID=UPI003F35816B